MRDEIQRELQRQYGETEPITEIMTFAGGYMVFTAHRCYRVRRRLDPQRLPA